jgi:hypothetical protein
MQTTNALVTYTDLTTMLVPVTGLTAPTGTQIATRSFIDTYYHVDTTSSPYSTYSTNRCPPYQTIHPQTAPYLACYNITTIDSTEYNCQGNYANQYQVWKISLVDQNGNAYVADQNYYFNIAYDYYWQSDVYPYQESYIAVTTLAVLQGQWQGFASFTVYAIETCPYSSLCDGSCYTTSNYMNLVSNTTGVPGNCSLPPNPPSTTTTTTSAYIPVTGLTWTTTSNTTGVARCQPSGWTVSNQNLRIRYDCANSQNCGGTCDITQTGIATATITVGGVNTYLGLDFVGIGELQAPDYEKIKFILNGGTYSNVELANAHAAGGNKGCQMGPVVKQYLVQPPYLLKANTVYTFKIDFTTNDPLYQVGAYYEVNLQFT